MKYLLAALAPVSPPGNVTDARLPLSAQPGVLAMMGSDYDDDFNDRLPLSAQPGVAELIGGDDDDLLGDLDAWVDLGVPASQRSDAFEMIGSDDSDLLDDDDDLLGDDDDDGDDDDLLGGDEDDEDDDDLLGGLDAWIDSSAPLTAAGQYDDEDLDDFGDDDDTDDQMGVLPLIPIMVAAALAAGPLNKERRRKLVAAMPHMDNRTLYKIAKNRARTRWVRNQAIRNLQRRNVPIDLQIIPERRGHGDYEQDYSQSYRRGGETWETNMPGVRTHRIEAARPIRNQGAWRQAPVPRVVQRVQPVRPMQRPQQRMPLTRPAPAKSQGPRTQQGRIRAAKQKARGGRNELIAFGQAPAGYELTPQLGSAMWSHPVKTVGLTAAVFGVGAMVGRDRVVDAAQGLFDAVTGLFRG